MLFFDIRKILSRSEYIVTAGFLGWLWGGFGVASVTPTTPIPIHPIGFQMFATAAIVAPPKTPVPIEAAIPASCISVIII